MIILTKKRLHFLRRKPKQNGYIYFTRPKLRSRIQNDGLFSDRQFAFEAGATSRTSHTARLTTMQASHTAHQRAQTSPVNGKAIFKFGFTLQGAGQTVRKTAPGSRSRPDSSKPARNPMSRCLSDSLFLATLHASPRSRRVRYIAAITAKDAIRAQAVNDLRMMLPPRLAERKPPVKDIAHWAGLRPRTFDCEASSVCNLPLINRSVSIDTKPHLFDLLNSHSSRCTVSYRTKSSSPLRTWRKMESLNSMQINSLKTGLQGIKRGRNVRFCSQRFK